MPRSKKPLFIITFPDGSAFALPEQWKAVFIASFGRAPETYKQIAERLHFVVDKYIEHQAWPTKLDGIADEENTDDNRYDDPDFYFEHWNDWKENKKKWGERTITNPPTWADIADAALYQQLRPALMQQTLNKIVRKKGGTPIKVVTPDEFVQELDKQKKKN